MTTLIAAIAIVFFISVLVSLSRSGSAAVIGGAPFGADKLSLFAPEDQIRNTDSARSRVDLSAAASRTQR